MMLQTISIAVVIILLLVILYVLQQQRTTRPAIPYSIVTTFNGDPTEARAFAWTTDDSEAGSILQLVPGTDAAALNTDAALTFQGRTTLLEIDGTILGSHKVEAEGLTPGTTYTYRVGSGEADGWSSPAQFTTAEQGDSSTGAKLSAFTFLNLTDSQGVTEQDFKLWGSTLNKAFELYPDARFVIHNGDFTEDANNSDSWRYLFEQAMPWAASIPLMPVVGNNDVWKKEGATPLTARFNVPDNGAAGVTGNYSFDYGTVHVAVLNTEEEISTQTNWLDADLAKTEQPWLIVAIHRPMYGGSTYKKIKEWADIIDRYKVDLVLQGHNHEYSRSYPLRDGKVTGAADKPVPNHTGTVYVVTNTSGPKFNEKKDDQFYHAVHLQNNKQMFAAITVEVNKLTYTAYTADGEEIDQFAVQH
ncbi:metallophosphoesterase family protein [Paenibacillus sp. CCS19]|uniref:purple acid phosphatase family protein n=1 Tax=Paenibacillus sp. CCS19 TaxID=3158387 RepID=UPI00295F0D86|nr:metallophosphoesterase family protein [Paenibacillus cellulosilyticus]